MGRNVIIGLGILVVLVIGIFVIGSGTDESELAAIDGSETEMTEDAGSTDMAAEDSADAGAPAAMEDEAGSETVEATDTEATVTEGGAETDTADAGDAAATDATEGADMEAAEATDPAASDDASATESADANDAAVTGDETAATDTDVAATETEGDAAATDSVETATDGTSSEEVPAFMTVEGFDADEARDALADADVDTVERASLEAGITAAEEDETLVPEVTTRLQQSLLGNEDSVDNVETTSAASSDATGETPAWLTTDGFDAEAAREALENSDVGTVERAALSAGISAAEDDPALVAELVDRLQTALGY